MGGAMTVERGETLRAIARDGEAVKWRHELGACFGVACESDSTSEPESAKCGIVDSARLVVMMVRQVMVVDGREDAAQSATRLPVRSEMWRRPSAWNLYYNIIISNK